MQSRGMAGRGAWQGEEHGRHSPLQPTPTPDPPEHDVARGVALQERVNEARNRQEWANHDGPLVTRRSPSRKQRVIERPKGPPRRARRVENLLQPPGYADIPIGERAAPAHLLSDT